MEKTKKRAIVTAPAPIKVGAAATQVSSKRRRGGQIRGSERVENGRSGPIAYDSIAQAAAAMGVPKSVLRKLKRDGAPGFHGSRVYPAELRPHLETMSSAATATADRDALECRRLLAQCKRIEHANLQCKRIEHANLVESAGVIAVAPVLAAIATIGEQLKSALRAIYEDELPPVISGLSPEAIRIETRKANDRLCAKFFAGTDKIAKAA